MIRERLRKWLGIEDNASKLTDLKKELFLIKENLENQISQLRAELETQLKDKVEREELNELLFRLDELEREVKLLEKYSLLNARVGEISHKEMLKQKILDILSTREEITISELQSLVGCGWKKLYQLLKELEKEEKLRREKKKGRVILKPINPL
ncbi:leucine zipper and winged helix DNA-binding domain [Pyrococcus abyssi virus 1]|uniref:leucine zipper and winged helix DNA-binding domain n=1 Tax=Pyrococcus abyssi virus 1 TaxID=425386 RepID=UPI00015529CA|nr:leucine zipper and winged helix DNA-binding domain [Pyrococcus abyssi virus 1]ABN58509.1 leucine zipper and winged helix DNA-binding domain [Pyrococcus abyssi virus 1]